MKCTIPEISWHNREPILSVDIQPIQGKFYRLATGSSDSLVLIWQLKISDSGAVDVEVLSELTRHQKAVNAVRWSPDGQYLASGDDDANIILWQMKVDNVPLLEGDNNFKETWNVHKILRGHKEDVYDICWSPNGNKLLSGSVDNSAILWDMNKAQSEYIITDQKNFVQGVAWDPKNQFIATMSNDRICRIFEQNGRRVRARIGRGPLPVDESHPLHNKEVKYFHDDTFKSFFRRLTFSPDGSFLIVPSGCIESEDCKSAMYGTFIFTLDSFKQPAAIFPSPKQCSIVAKCSPILYELRPKGSKPLIDLPYRIIIAIATDSDVILYDTQQNAPFACLQKVHYTRLTDLTWSHDGLLLVVSSTDGFISLVTFEENELGKPYVKDESEPEDHLMSFPEETEKIEEKVPEIKSKKPSFLEQWAKKSNKQKVEQKPTEKIVKEVILIEESPVKNQEPEINVNVKKRITPITISEKCSKPNEIKVEQKVTKRITPITLSTSSPKKRIVPTKVEPSCSTKNDFKPIEKFIVNGVETDPKNFTMCKTLREIEEKSVCETSSDEPPPKKKKLEQSKLTPNKAAEKTPKEKKKSPTSAKKTPKVTLLQFLKPLSDKKEKPDKSSDVKVEEKSVMDCIKIKPTSLFKVASSKKDEVVDLCDESIDPSEDFKLFVEEDSVTEEVKVEKENTGIVDKKVELVKAEAVKQARRVPLITLSSPKAKKKKV
ncbi:PREDICTED: chromatin assembly factor 1 subunit B [Nicrophorus vespilloides]|uniref:Chromatin assembly factor 1 subunit B n=1 Tax=Nicrophorus vespilloides TaxID=110193 RepID=A0ABM1M6A8_NICVS|nr:PREDICTED: chromatin assembly factor 1 subunit B [Nicrophorus vespilloides]